MPLAVIRVLGNALLIIGLLALNLGGIVGSSVFFAILTAMVFASPEAALKALAICYLGLMINTAFVPKSLVWAPARIVLPMLALLRFGLDLAVCRVSILNRGSYIGLLAFAATMAICSIASGWFTDIALLKISYFIGFMTMIFAATTVLRHRRTDLGEWFVALSLSAILYGIASIVLGVDNNFRAIRVDVYEKVYSTMFNGAFSHPNVHAVYASLSIVFLMSVWLLSRYRQRWLVVPMIACWGMFVAWSASRTAALSTVVGFLILAVYAKPFRSRSGQLLLPHLSRRVIVGVGSLAAATALFWNASTNNSLVNTLTAYVMKTQAKEFEDTTQLSFEGVILSRKALVDFSWQNFLENPYFGIGFGVAKTETFRQNATYLTAPAEKGFLPTAILEEGGVIGTSMFVLFVILFARDLLKDRNVPALVMSGTFLATNLGEMTIFSPGGAGGFGWIMIVAATLMGDRCWTDAGRASGPPTVPRTC